MQWRPRMFDTRNDLPANTRTKVIELLNARLADAIDLGTQSKHAHWNVKGPSFIALHELFDKVAENIEEHIDTLAERVTALGGTARGTLAAVARSTSLRPYPEEDRKSTRLNSSHDQISYAVFCLKKKKKKEKNNSTNSEDTNT